MVRLIMRLIWRTARLLHNVLAEHARWEHTLTCFHDGTRYLEPWIDSDGRERVTAITMPYLDCHRQIIQSLIADLVVIGQDGRAIVAAAMSCLLDAVDEEELR
jgi:hypothetical protein